MTDFTWADGDYSSALAMMTRLALEKRAGDKDQPAGPLDGVSEVATRAWQEPAVRLGLLGAGVGGGAGLLRSLLRKKKRPVLDTLTGALLGGVAGGGAGLAWGATGGKAPPGDEPPSSGGGGSKPDPNIQKPYFGNLSHLDTSQEHAFNRDMGFFLGRQTSLNAPSAKILSIRAKYQEARTLAQAGKADAAEEARSSARNMTDDFVRDLSSTPQRGSWGDHRDRAWAQNKLDAPGEYLNELDLPGFKHVPDSYGTMGAAAATPLLMAGGRRYFRNAWNHRALYQDALGRTVTGEPLSTFTTWQGSDKARTGLGAMSRGQAQAALRYGAGGVPASEYVRLRDMLRNNSKIVPPRTWRGAGAGTVASAVAAAPLLGWLAYKEWWPGSGWRSGAPQAQRMVDLATQKDRQP